MAQLGLSDSCNYQSPNPEEHAYYKSKNITLYEGLMELYETYGYSVKVWNP